MFNTNIKRPQINRGGHHLMLYDNNNRKITVVFITTGIAKTISPITTIPHHRLQINIIDTTNITSQTHPTKKPPRHHNKVTHTPFINSTTNIPQQTYQKHHHEINITTNTKITKIIIIKITIITIFLIKTSLNLPTTNVKMIFYNH